MRKREIKKTLYVILVLALIQLITSCAPKFKTQYEQCLDVAKPADCEQFLTPKVSEKPFIEPYKLIGAGASLILGTSWIGR